MTIFRMCVEILVDGWILVGALFILFGLIGWIITLVRPASPRLAATGAGPARRAARPKPTARRASLRLVDER